MATEPSHLEANLRDQLTRTSDWLKFAEAKNAALLTFASAWLLAMGNMTFGSATISNSTRLAIAVAAPFVLVGAFCAIASILPGIPVVRPKVPGENLLFYDNIREIVGSNNYQRFKNRYDDMGSPSTSYFEDLSTQIAINSAIASRKFRLFLVGASSIMASIVMFAGFAYGPSLIDAIRPFFCCAC